jgi:hypothetical protein
MSSPKAAKAPTVKAAPAAKPSARAAKPASDEGMTRQDKANFIKSMMEGIKPKDAPKTKAKAPVEPLKKVEILRKISAPVKSTIPPTPESIEALKFAAMLEAKLANGEFGVLTPEAFQTLMAAMCKLYSANAESGNKFSVVEGRLAITGTDAMITCAGLLKAVDLQVFELGMWQSWAGI